MSSKAAEKWIVARQSPEAIDTVGLFPTEHGGGVVFSLAETNNQNRHFSEFFGQLTAAYAEVLAEDTSASLEVVMPVARACMVPLAHAFFERTLRVSKLLATGVPVLGVLKAHPVPTPDCCEDLYYLASESFDFNQQMLNHLAPAFGLDVAEREASAPPTRLPELNGGYQNHLSYLKRPSAFRRLLRRAQAAWSKRTGRVIAYGMTQTYFPSLDRGLYGFGGFAALPDLAVLDAPPPDFDRRRRLLLAMSIHSGHAIEACLAPISDVVDWMSLNQAFNEIAESFLPTTLLEGLTSNLDRARLELAEYKKSKTIYSTNFSLQSRSVILCAAAIAQGLKVISSQHGGHYGYMKQQTIALECEFPFAERWVTWGWPSTEAHPNAPKEKFVPLPSPWMSERAIEWTEVLSGSERFTPNKRYDIAFMPNKVYSYCPAPSGAHATGNFLEAFCESVVDLVYAATSVGLTVLHKPYGTATMALMSDTLDKLAEVGRQKYQLSASLDKGLHPALVRDIGLFVWDQPGTGFLECLAANIPTLVFWPRIYNCENEDATPLFSAMEAQGLVHRETHTLVAAALEFRHNPRGWWENPERQASARAFMGTYFQCSARWLRSWKQFVATLD